ncbi:MAG TPA: DNA polymerase III subunit epsilon [Ferrovibrio sp.]|jgi:DNA polymerase-3 subunit epsilon|uniref:DNA polymerase III subunit epsilon n=1 Tax=Ferrovibrio sp. TaxID=1917215 RepID=UPI002B4B4C3D|nr:DNA polymerase III subunit epsilon [Ferrovibrio sp.]HLT76479.1 DNA polymerase III subunit epsilon [Ferrovibrio sp.]
MREVVLDTETTGLDPRDGDRVVEIGCIELINHIPTGKHFHVYINPERPMPEEAFKVHGLSDEFLKDKPVFAAIAKDFCEFIGEDPLVIHNASFDIGFLNAELARLDGMPHIAMERAIDTVRLARGKFPGAQVSLDALCKRFNIDLSARIKHGALLDAELLAEVYLELVGGRQQGLGLTGADGDGQALIALPQVRGPARPPRPHAPTEAELAAHAQFLAKLKDPLWLRQVAEAAD